MARLVVFLGLCVCLLGACVPAKKLVYFQQGDELKNRKNIPKDTVLRTHDLNIREYRIQPLDLLSVQFETLSDESDLFDFLAKLNPQGRMSNPNMAAANGILVDKAGELEYPVLGKIKVGGLTLFEAQDTLKRIASRYIQDVAVRVRMLNFRYTVLGEVRGEQTVTSTNTRLTMSEAIALAGGFGEMADRANVKVIRQNENVAEIYYINLLEEQFIESKYYYVQQNDVIVVPPLKQRTFRAYWTTNIGIITATLSFLVLIVTLADRY